MAYHIGELDQRISFTRKVLAPDGMGGVLEAPREIIGECWALMKPLSGKERAAFGSVEASALYRCVIRRRADIREDDTVEWEGVSFNVRAILDYGPREPFMELQVERGVAL